MSRKFKKLARSLSEKAGVSHAGAVNILRRGSPQALRPLDPVLIRLGARPLSGEHTHQAGLVSAVLGDGTVVVTPAWPRNTLGGLSFSGHEKPARYRAEDVRPYPLKKGERYARFVESVFDHVPYDPGAEYSMASTPWLFRKPPESEVFVVGESGDSILAIRKPEKVIIPLWDCESPLVEDGVVVGQDAVRMTRSVRERMVACIACAAFETDLLSPEPPLPTSVPDGCEWIVDDIDDTMSQDLGMILDPSSVVGNLHYPFQGRYACGSGKVGRYVVSPGSRGVLLSRSDVSVVWLSRDGCKPGV